MVDPDGSMSGPTRDRSSSSGSEDKDCPTREEVAAAKARPDLEAAPAPTALAAPEMTEPSESSEEESQEEKKRRAKKEKKQANRAARKAREKEYEQKVRSLKEREQAVRLREEQLRGRGPSSSNRSDSKSSRRHRRTASPSRSSKAKPRAELRLTPAWCYCPRHGEAGCRKWVQSQWALVQHLRSKHGLSEDASKEEAAKVWAKQAQPEVALRSRSPPGTRRPASPKGRPPSARREVSPSVAIVERRAKEAQPKAKSAPALDLLSSMFAVADRILSTDQM